MDTLLFIGVVASLALLVFSLWRIRRQKKALVVAMKNHGDEEFSTHPSAVGIWMLEPGETVYFQTDVGQHCSFRVVDHNLSFFELRGDFADVRGKEWVEAYVLGTELGKTQFKRQFVPGGKLHFMAVVEDSRNGEETQRAFVTATITRIFRTPYDLKKDKL